MHLILLPGNSLHHKEWIQKVNAVMKSAFSGTTIQNYQHWETGEELLNMEHELSVLVESVKNLGEYAIFAKSAGTLLAMRGVKEGKLHPTKCVFLGTPVTWGREAGFAVDEWLQNYHIPTLFIQQTNDRTCSLDELSSSLKKASVENHTIKEIPGNDHNYDDLEMLKTETVKFISPVSLRA